MQTTDHAPSARQQQRQRAGVIAGCLADCLQKLDAMDQGLAAVHVSMALDILERDYSLSLND